LLPLKVLPLGPLDSQPVFFFAPLKAISFFFRQKEVVDSLPFPPRQLLLRPFFSLFPPPSVVFVFFWRAVFFSLFSVEKGRDAFPPASTNRFAFSSFPSAAFPSPRLTPFYRPVFFRNVSPSAFQGFFFFSLFLFLIWRNDVFWLRSCHLCLTGGLR